MNAWRALGLSVMALLVSTAAGATVVVHDDRGAVLTFAASPQRIVSLLPSLTESVCALGACTRLVGTDRYSNVPESVRTLPKLGGMEDAQVERIVALRPDVVLAAPSARVIERLEALGLKVLVLESRDHADVRHSLDVLAQLLGAPERAAALWARIDAQTRAAMARVPLAWRGQRVYFEVDATPYAAGAGSFIGETLQQLGMGNIVPPALGPFPKLNPEYVVRAQPDVLMAPARNLAEMPQRPGWSRLVALQKKRACGFDAARYELLTRPGPRLGEAALVLADCLARLPIDAAP
jgi:iron complex transport system substrate-binding protein